jgi:hypothetical protein
MEKKQIVVAYAVRARDLCPNDLIQSLLGGGSISPYCHEVEVETMSDRSVGLFREKIVQCVKARKRVHVIHALSPEPEA